MRHLPILLLVLALAACQSEQGKPAAEAAEPIPSGPITMSEGNVSITIDPEYGARITSYKYKGREVLRTERDPKGYQWGSTAWPSPQEDWDWPPPATLDSKPYEVQKVRNNVYLFTSALDSTSLLRMTKRVMMTETGEVGLSYTIKNETGFPIKLGAWENTRLPYAGRVEFYVGDTAWVSKGVLPLEENEDVNIIRFDEQNTEQKKIYASLRDTMVRYINDGLVFTKQTVITGINQVPEGQAPLEIFLDPKKGFVEFELQGGVYSLEPEQSASLYIKWLVREE